MTMSDTPAVLMREVHAAIINISESGCLFASRRRLAVGTVGAMRVRFGTEEYRDHIEIVRCLPIDGAYQVAVRFLWTTPRHGASIRHALARRIDELQIFFGTTLVM
jgi:hypothetical protein